MLTRAFDYALPTELIAQEPIEPRDASRLLVLDRASGCIAHRRFRDLPSLLRDKLRPAVASAGGTLVVLSCGDAAELTRGDVWGPPGDGATVFRAIKDRFDPHDLLNPGRFIYQD